MINPTYSQMRGRHELFTLGQAEARNATRARTIERSLLAPPSFRHQREHPRAEEHQGSGLGNG